MSELRLDEIKAAHTFVMEKGETQPYLANIAMESLAKHDVPKLLDAITTLRAERDAALRGQAQLREALDDAVRSLAGVRSWSQWMQAHAPMDSAAVFDAFWSWAEGWDCDLELRLAALTATPTDGRGEQLREALAIAAEKVGALYAMYTAGTAFWNDGDGELIVDAGWEARLIEADAVLSRALTATATDK